MPLILYLEYLKGELKITRKIHNSFETMANISVASVAMTYMMDSSKTLVLIINWMLYFGETLDDSLISPNKTCSYGIHISDDPLDIAREFGIKTDESFIPFLTEGLAIYFKSHISLDEELKY